MTNAPKQPREPIETSTEAPWLSTFAEIGAAVIRAHGAMDEFLKSNEEILRQLAQAAIAFPTAMRSAWVKAAEQGWYLPPDTPTSAIHVAIEGGKCLDDYMMELVDEDWDQATAKLKDVYPARKHILQVAFDLHRTGNYIASIPLFFAQADGICAQELRAFLFLDHDDRAKKVAQRLAESDDGASDIFLSLFTLRTQIQASISKASSNKKANGPNRSGILHGSSKHLDYGTRINGYKAYCLLWFVGMCLENRSGDD
jgi:hypothetical protein